MLKPGILFLQERKGLIEYYKARVGFFYGADAGTVEFQDGEAGADSEARYV